MLAGSVLILAGIMGTALYALRRSRRGHGVSERAMLIGGGVLFPFVTLFALMVWSLVGERLAAEDDPSLFRLEARGHQFWWEFTYPDVGGAPLYGAGEAFVPAGEPLLVALESQDVIHSFWVPRLAGKMDAIPGRTNLMRLAADAPGTYAGQCAEFCGNQHLNMRFIVHALPAAELAARLEALAATAPDPALPGAADFAEHCAACHSVDPRRRGGPGPNLAALALRSQLGGGAPYAGADDLRRWLLDHPDIKPGSRKPPTTVNHDTLDRIITYLESTRP